MAIEEINGNSVLIGPAAFVVTCFLAISISTLSNSISSSSLRLKDEEVSIFGVSFSLLGEFPFTQPAFSSRISGQAQMLCLRHIDHYPLMAPGNRAVCSPLFSTSPRLGQEIMVEGGADDDYRQRYHLLCTYHCPGLRRELFKSRSAYKALLRPREDANHHLFPSRNDHFRSLHFAMVDSSCYIPRGLCTSRHPFSAKGRREGRNTRGEKIPH
jgi:hypothetical protein